MRKMKPQKPLLQLVMLALLSVVSVLGLSGEAMAALQCYSCHGGPSPSTDVRPMDATHRNITSGGFVGSHRKHMSPTATVGDCNTCHVNNGTTNMAHRDGQIGMTAGPGYSKPLFFNQTSAPILGNCSNASCHANVYGTGNVTTPVWGDATKGCSTCHTTPIGTNGPATGNHTNVTAHAVACTACHEAGTTNLTPPDVGHIDTNIDTANVGYPLDKVKGSAAATCSTASCHANVYGTGAVTTPVWGTTGNGCNSCHTTPIGATGPATGSHANTVGHAVACTTCHVSGTTATTKPSTAHVDGNIDVANVGYPVDKAKGSAPATCSTASCHANVYGTGTFVTPVWGTTGNGCSACHSTPIGATGPATGSHANTAGHAVACTTCHATGTTSTTVPDSAHTDGNIDVANVGYPLDKVKGSAPASCSTASCHANVYGTGTIATPVWGTTGNGCSACHTTPIGTNGPATGNHTNVVAHAVACTSCHATGTTATTAPSLANGHADGNIDTANVGYPADKTKGSAAATCLTAGCHQNPYGTGSAVTPVWGTTANGCNACHLANPIGTNGPATGSHTNTAGHAVACTNCHTTGTTATTVGLAHRDGNIDIANVGYPANKVKGSAATTCSTAACHANVYGTGFAVTPVWGTTGNGCNACHTTPIGPTGPATGNHTNVTAHAVACTTCHAAGTTATSAPSTGHNDTNIDVANVGYPLDKLKGSAGATCSTASCHANVYGTGFATTPAWGTTGSGCSACHSTPIGVNGPSTGSHDLHAGKACTSCHATGTTATTAPGAGHTDGNIDVVGVGYPADKVKGSGYATCSAAACHSPFLNAPADNASTWGTVTGDCAFCHGYAPATGSHDIHSISVLVTSCASCHSNVGGAGHINGTIDVTQSYPPTNKHNVGVYGGTCSTSCHNAYSTTAGQVTPVWGTGSTCASCHDASPATGSHSKHVAHTTTVTCDSCHVAAGGFGHINANVDVAAGGYLTTVAKHTAGVGYSSCSNVSCHNGGNAAAAFTAPAMTWGVTANCGTCHGYPPASTNHADAGGKDCNSCHSNVVAGGTQTSSTFTNLQLHLNGTVEGGKCNSCHGYPPVQSFAGLTNYSGAKLQNYSGGGGVHAVAGHLNPFIRPSSGFGDAGTAAPGCATCHPSTAHNGGQGVFKTAEVQVVVDPQFKFDKNRPIVYNGKNSGTGKTSGTCANVACHFQKSPIWSNETYTQGH